MKRFELKTFANDRELARGVANLWLDKVSEALQQSLSQSVALSGGRIARQFFIEVADHAIAQKISLNNVDFFWADERCVPPTDPESNFFLANENLFKPLKIATEKIHRLRGELVSALAVGEANSEIKKIVPLKSEGQPMLDFIFLGVGEDGHVASLFPNASAEIQKNQSPFLFITDSPKPPPNRITLSYAAIAAANEVWVLASGSGKERILAESLSGAAPTPLALVLQSRQLTKIFTDLKIP